MMRRHEEAFRMHCRKRSATQLGHACVHPGLSATTRSPTGLRSHPPGATIRHPAASPLPSPQPRGACAMTAVGRQSGGRGRRARGAPLRLRGRFPGSGAEPGRAGCVPPGMVSKGPLLRLLTAINRRRMKLLTGLAFVAYVACE